MRDTIKKQLEQCNYVNLCNFNPETNTFTIPKYNKPQFKQNGYYLVKISKAIVGNPNSVTATNWNKGFAPQRDYMKIYISKIMGKMIYVDGMGYDFETKQDTNYMWSGWLCTDDLEQLASF